MPLLAKMGLFSSRTLRVSLRNADMGGIMNTFRKIVYSTVQPFCRRSLHQNGPKKDKFVIAIEGNIGSGKTSLLNYFSQQADVEVLMEPVNKWRNIRGHNGLGKMYEDPSRWSLTFQTYVQLTMLQAHTSPFTKPVKLMERSIYSAKYCFVENLHKSGKMPDIEYVVLTEWFDWIIKNQPCNLDLIVYLRTDPEVVHSRIKRRCRKEEEAIPIEYLRSLHELHEDWLIHKKIHTPFPILVLDGNLDFEDMMDVLDAHKDQILCSHS